MESKVTSDRLKPTTYKRNLFRRSFGNDTDREKNNNAINNLHKRNGNENIERNGTARKMADDINKSNIGRNGTTHKMADDINKSNIERNGTPKMTDDINKSTSPGKRKIEEGRKFLAASPVKDPVEGSRHELHRASTLDMLDIETTKQNATSPKLTGKYGKAAIEFFPDTVSENIRYNSVFVQLSDRTDKKFKIDKSQKTRRQKLEDLKHRSMRKCGSDSMEHSAVYASMLESYDEVIESNACEPASSDEKACNRSQNVGGPCLKRTLSDYEREAFMRRDLVLAELLDSEKNYIDDLQFIVEKFLPLMTSEHVTDDLEYTCDTIYMNISDIYSFHVETFHAEIEKCFENPDHLDEVFTTHEDKLTALYTLYCGQKPIADESLTEHEDELDELCHKMFPDVKLRIKDFLIKPVQRLMKYQLLLTSIKKYGIKAGKTAVFLDAAIDAMERVPKEANDAMHVGLITGYEGSGCSVKHLLMHGQLEVAVGNRKARTMHVFLFQSVCLFTEKASKLVPEYKCISSDDNSCLGFSSNNNLSFVIFFRKHTKTDIYKCEATTEDDKIQWSYKIQQAMSYKDMQKRKQSVRRQLTIEIAPSDIELAENRRKPESSVEEFERLEIEEAVIKAMFGHPRLGIMSERLKCNIENYIANEFIIPMMSPESPLITHKTITHRTTVPLTNTLEPVSPFRRGTKELPQRRSVSPPRWKGKKSKKNREKEAAKRARSKSLSLMS